MRGEKKPEKKTWELPGMKYPKQGAKHKKKMFINSQFTTDFCIYMQNLRQNL